MASSMMFTCSKCQKAFTERCKLHRHLRRVHKEGARRGPTPPSLKCLLCSEAFDKKHIFISHIEQKHDFVAQYREITFSSVGQFESWKMRLEKEDMAIFIIRSSTNDVKYYKCNRSGRYRTGISPDNRKRELKGSGSRKINSLCPASITARFSPQGCVSVVVQKAHFGHDKNPVHLPLGAPVKKAITEKLAASVSQNEILCDLQVVGEPDRANLVTKQDLRNIMAQFGLKTEPAGHSEHDSVDDRAEVGSTDLDAMTAAIVNLPEDASDLEKRKQDLIEFTTSLIDGLTTLEQVEIAEKTMKRLKNGIVLTPLKKRILTSNNPHEVPTRGNTEPQRKSVIDKKQIKAGRTDDSQPAACKQQRVIVEPLFSEGFPENMFSYVDGSQPVACEVVIDHV